MNVLIADDESHARTRLASLIREISAEFRVVGEAENGAEAVELGWNFKPDLVLLDIRMPVLDGMEAARELAKVERPPSIIFTTAYDQHALQAFEANAIDYLVKPIRKERLAAALEKGRTLSRARFQQLSASLSPEKAARTRLCVLDRGQLKLIPVADVRYFQADQKYVVVRTADQEFLMEDSLKALESEFNESFLRIHRNALVATKYISGLEKKAGGKMLVKFSGISNQLEVSRRQVTELRALIRRKA